MTEDVEKPCVCEKYCWKWRNGRETYAGADLGYWIRHRCRKLPADPIVEYWKSRGTSTRTARALAMDGLDFFAVHDCSDARLLQVPLFGKVGLSEVRQIIPNQSKAPPDTRALIEAATLIEKAAMKLRAIAAAMDKEKT